MVSPKYFEKYFRAHDCCNLTRLRRFIQAVLAYTGAPKVSLITHGMGVTLIGSPSEEA
ncbi:unnamed protein product [Cylicostephanus goldi]|uniref:Uncharacterized protein n=1 Tax=Cylicostephanus goldi TaxID=71465 RepID=A0A3P6SSS8_CYLGO|nr:unnamed protein product [Cylicostephanus goldi]